MGKYTKLLKFFGVKEKEEVTDRYPVKIDIVDCPPMMGLAAQIDRDLYVDNDALQYSGYPNGVVDLGPGLKGIETKTDIVSATNDTYILGPNGYELVRRKVTKRNKFSVQYYSSTPDLKRYPCSRANTFKVRSRVTDDDTVVQVSFVDSERSSGKVAEVRGDQDLQMHIKVGDTPEFSIPVHEAHDLALALMKYHELVGEATFEKVRKPKYG